MSHSGELFALRDDSTPRPGFELVRRGYDKQQVDQYVARVDSEFSALAAEHERAVRQLQELSGHMQQMQAELAEAQQRPTRLDRASFRHLGPMVSQIIEDAEKQAEVIATAAQEQANERGAQADKVLAEAREHAAQSLRELEAEMAKRRADEEKAHEQRRAAAQLELTGIRNLADKLRAEGEAARSSAEQEAKRINEQSAAQVERARSESESLLEAARAQLQREVESTRTQTQQELAQWQANVEREIGERRAAADQKIAQMHAEAQQHSAEVRRRANEQAAAAQQQLAAVQEDIQNRRETLTKLQAELDTGEQRLSQVKEEGDTVNREVTQLQQRLVVVRQGLAAELNRLSEARHAADHAERHAKDVRARVQREAKRVADLAAAAVMAAAAGGDTGEYPAVAARSGLRPGADKASEQSTADTAVPRAASDAEHPGYGGQTGYASQDGHDGRDDTTIPAQRGPLAEEEVLADADPR